MNFFIRMESIAVAQPATLLTLSAISWPRPPPLRYDKDREARRSGKLPPLGVGLFSSSSVRAIAGQPNQIGHSTAKLDWILIRRVSLTRSRLVVNSQAASSPRAFSIEPTGGCSQ